MHFVPLRGREGIRARERGDDLMVRLGRLRIPSYLKHVFGVRYCC